MKKIILFFLNFSICNHNPTRSEIEAGKNKWKRPKKIPPSDTVLISGKFQYRFTYGFTSGILDIGYTLPAGYETMIISAYQMMFPVARVIRIRKLRFSGLRISLGFLQIQGHEPAGSRK